ncbi:hypothetical protein AG1IA_10021 [Rhizoctonia solani AG-1 IA]|uniref:Uncharacterized protein n=1 Tax=Thanatephorus cucumeris (strain AG1-IA) TaxID=983506 RepID=L8WHT9_THACA|nr:hypothetical protein AG1IA_10021 [Rhizoctonia solani AG-1 IA]
MAPLKRNNTVKIETEYINMVSGIHIPTGIHQLRMQITDSATGTRRSVGKQDWAAGLSKSTNAKICNRPVWNGGRVSRGCELYLDWAFAMLCWCGQQQRSVSRTSRNQICANEILRVGVVWALQEEPHS